MKNAAGGTLTNVRSRKRVWGVILLGVMIAPRYSEGRWGSFIPFTQGGRPNAVRLANLHVGPPSSPDVVAALNERVIAVLCTKRYYYRDPNAEFEYLQLDGGNPKDVVAADFNGDGLTDLAIIRTDPYGSSAPHGDVVILLGDGDCRFQAQQLSIPFRYDNGNALPSALATGSLNESPPRADLAVAFSNEPVVAILLNTGTGFGFDPDPNQVRYPSVGAARNSIAVAALSGGHQNLHLTSRNALSVLPGNGDGTFRPVTDICANPSAGTVSEPELMPTPSADAIEMGATNTLRNKPAQATTDPTPSPTATPCSATGTTATEPTEFQLAPGAAGDNFPFHVAAVTSSGGGPQFAAISDSSADKISAFRAFPDGSFETSPTTVGVGRNPIAVAAGDMGTPGAGLFNDLTGRKALITANATGNSLTIVFQNPSSPYFGPTTETISDICEPTDLDVGIHFDNQGRPYALYTATGRNPDSCTPGALPAMSGNPPYGSYSGDDCESGCPY